MDARVPSGERRSDAVVPELPHDLHDRIGQMVLAGFRGLTPQEAAVTLRQIEAGSIGAVVLYDVDAHTGGPRNMKSPQQLAELVAAVKAAGPIAPLVAVDAEGGHFHKLQPRHGFPSTSSAREVGARNDPTLTRSNAGVIADVLAEVGINMNLAPVVDLLDPENQNAIRTGRFCSPDPEVVISFAREFILAHRARGILTTIKHFPGMRGTMQPYLPGVGEPIEGWSEEELKPFRTLIAEDLADAVLTTRETYPPLDPALPACLSPKIVGGLLRTELGFNGVAISDPMEMRGIWNVLGLARGTVLAVKAGIDMVLVCNMSSVVPYSDDRADQVIEALTQAVASGEIPESRINEACGRILALKARVPHN